MQYAGIPWVEYGPAGNGLFRMTCRVCNATAAGPVQGVSEFARDHRTHQTAAPGYDGLGDLVAHATHALGVQPCTPCEQRRAFLNRFAPQMMRRR